MRIEQQPIRSTDATFRLAEAMKGEYRNTITLTVTPLEKDVHPFTGKLGTWVRLG
jgi:hypothetical protein